MNIKLTKHAYKKMHQRSIVLDDIREILLRPDFVEPDKFDKSLTHFIGNKGGRYLRIIGKQENTGDLLIISAFFDRRLKRLKK